MLNIKDNYLNEYNKVNDKNMSFNQFLAKKSFDIIYDSNLFDKEFYIKHYFDSENIFDLINHYLNYGVKNNTQPNAFFDSTWYFNFYDDAKNSGLDPLVHYIIFGKDDGKFTSYSEYLFNSSKTFNNIQINDILEKINQKIAIIVPIYNAYDDVKKCVESVFNNTKIPFELILIDDNSTDDRISEFLDTIKEKENVKIIQNKENKGFVKNVNLGISNSKNDVVLLNSDTIVTDKWLQKLVITAYSNPRIGTVTPVSNNAGAFSVPICNEDNIIPESLGIEGMANIVEKSSKRIIMSVPTGNGFCMFIKRDTISSIGLFDDENFGRGYGEENDFCMRCINKGWINVIDDATYIYHKKGASFSEEREKLIKKHRNILNSKYPTYSEEVKMFLTSDDLNNLQNNVNLGLSDYNEKKLNQKRILYVLHKSSGGTPQTNNDLMNIVQNYLDCYLLVSDGNKMELYHFLNNNLNFVRSYTLNSKWYAENMYIGEFRDIYFDILVHYSIDIVHIRHLIYHTFDLPLICNKLKIPVCLSFHDFYFICPSYNLIDDKQDYCGGICTEGNGNCHIPLNGLTQVNYIKDFVDIWRKEIGQLFNYIDSFVTTSNVVKDIFLRTYPVLQEKHFNVIEHGRDFEKVNKNLFEIPSLEKPIKILFIGNINLQKGSELIKSLFKLDKGKHIEFHFLGKTINELKYIGIHHGEYVRDELCGHIEKIKPSFIGIFSIWSETYCHTLSEAWAAGIPVLSTKIGVLEERVLKNDGGWFIDHKNINNTYDLILKIANNKKEYLSKINSVKNICFKSIKEMGNEYLKIYEFLLHCKLENNNEYYKRYGKRELIANEELLEELQIIFHDFKSIIDDSEKKINVLIELINNERKEKNDLISQINNERKEKNDLIQQLNYLKSFKGWINNKF